MLTPCFNFQQTGPVHRAPPGSTRSLGGRAGQAEAAEPRRRRAAPAAGPRCWRRTWAEPGACVLHCCSTDPAVAPAADPIRATVPKDFATKFPTSPVFPCRSAPSRRRRRPRSDAGVGAESAASGGRRSDSVRDSECRGSGGTAAAVPPSQRPPAAEAAVASLAAAEGLGRIGPLGSRTDSHCRTVAVTTTHCGLESLDSMESAALSARTRRGLGAESAPTLRRLCGCTD
jgi:hypothetical protein